MKQITWGSLVGGLGLLLLLGMFALLVSRRYTSVIPVPATPVVNATVSTGETVSTAQTLMDAIKRPVSVITATASLTTGNAIPTQWQQFSSKTAGYSLFHPPASVSQSRKLPSISEYVQITFSTPWVSQPSAPPYDLMFLEIRVYDTSEEHTLEAFLSDQYKAAFGESGAEENLHALMSHPVKVTHNITGYLMDWRIAATRMLFVIPHNDKFYTFALVHQFSSVELSAEETALFNRIITTIRFE